MEAVKFKPSYELKVLDSNCSDCLFMDRSIPKRQTSVDKHYVWQKNHFDMERMKVLTRAEYWQNEGDMAKAKLLLQEARKMVFQFNEGECALHYGMCHKYDKDVSFIPNTIQLDTQDCFVHRKEFVLNPASK